MRNKLVIFGDGDIAELAAFYFSNDSDYEVVGFVVDDDYLKRESLFDRPVIGLSKLKDVFPPENHSAFVAVSYTKMNHFRADRYQELKQFGYRMATYISSRCTNFAVTVGENCFILEDNTLQPFVRIGNNVTLWSGNHIGHHSTIDDHTFVSSHVVISGGVRIQSYCFIGVNATIRDHVLVKDHTLVGMGTVLSRSTDSFSVYRVSGSRPDSDMKSTDIKI